MRAVPLPGTQPPLTSGLFHTGKSAGLRLTSTPFVAGCQEVPTSLYPEAHDAGSLEMPGLVALGGAQG